MAVWQYMLIVIPKVSISENYECIFKNNKTQFLPETKMFWKNFDIDVSSLIQNIDKIISRSNWGGENSFNWKEDGENDNDCSVYLNDKKNRIEEFQFRVDLRNKLNVVNFLQPLLNICETNNLILLNLKGQILQPNLKSVVENLKRSNAASFLENPIKFIENLDNTNTR